MTIYLDIFILKNFIFNIVIIFLCGRILKHRVNLKRYIFSAFIGAIYVLIVLMFNSKFILSNFGKFIIGIIMVLIAYPISDYKEIFKICMLFIFVSSCIGGFASVINSDNVFLKQLLAFLFSTIIFYVFWKIKNNRIICDQYMCNVKINIDNTEINLRAYIDTGNTLKDSVSDDSVMFVAEEVLKQKLSPQLIKILNGEILELDEKYYGKIKMIEYQTIGSSDNLLIGIKVDNVIVENEDCTIKNEKVIIAPTERKFNNCEAIIGINILEEGYVYGNNTSFENKGKKIME